MNCSIVYRDNNLVIETSYVKKKITLTDNGQFLLIELINKLSSNSYTKSHLISDEFHLIIDNIYISGATPGWIFDDFHTEIMSQGEVHGWITLTRQSIKVTRHYVAYPETGFISEWTEYNNIGSDVILNDPSIFVQRLIPGNIDEVDYAYMTGGANFTGSTIMKTVSLYDGFTKDFDSNGSPEMIEVDGVYADKRHQRYNGTGIWFSFMAMRNRNSNDGWVLHFDYQGWWTASFTCRDRMTSSIGNCKLSNYLFKSGDTLRMPNVTLGVFVGDWDDLGNTNNNFIYQYKWDYTRDKYFNRTNFTIWRAAPLNDKVFRMVEMARYIGSERIWVDDFWFDAKGNYNGVFGDDWKHINEYIKKNGMLFRLWMPPWHADRLSKVWLEHPEWMIDFHGNWYNWTIDMSQEDAYQWILTMLKNKQKEFGTYDLRVDGDPCNIKNDGSFDIEYEGDWNASFRQSQNFYRLYKEFKEQNPDAGLDGCSSGGHTLSIESVRYTDQQQITDGACMHMGGYWTTMIMPIDKHQGMPIAGHGRTSFMQYSPDHLNLFSATGAGNQNPEQPYTFEALEGLRKEHELFYWLRKQKVYGRWIQVFRPCLEHGDATYVLQRMSRDLDKGLIMISSWATNPMLGKSERIFPKGLKPESNYLIESLRGSMISEEKSGSIWMTEGIYLNNIQPGEYLFINLPDRPGSTNTTANTPKIPTDLVKKAEKWLNHEGIGISWTPVTDNGRLVHYEVQKNGQLFTKVSSGSYLFDHLGNINDTYSVRSVDSDGRCSDYAQI